MPAPRRPASQAETNLFNDGRGRHSVAGIFDSIPVIVVTLFAVGLVGIMVYERSRARLAQEEAGGGAAPEDAPEAAGAAPEADAGGGREGGRRRDGGSGGREGGRRGGRRGGKKARS